jgi:hypothetical protein
MGLSRPLLSILSAVCSANTALKVTSVALKLFLRIRKSLFSTFWKDVVIDSLCYELKTEVIPQIRLFGSRRHGQDEKRLKPVVDAGSHRLDFE